MKKPKSKSKKSKTQRSEWTTVPVEGTGDRGPYPPDSSDLQRRIKANPHGVAAEARHKLHELQGGYRRDLYAVLALIVGIGRHYYFDYKAWKSFFNQDFFRTGKIKRKARTHQVNSLRHTMNYVFNATSKQARNRTGKYAAALHEIMLVGVPVDRVAEEIERSGGIEKLYEAYLEREALKPKKGRHRAQTEAEYKAAAEYLGLDGQKKSAEPEDMTLDDLEADQEEPGLEHGEEEGVLGDGGDGAEDGLDIFDDAELEPKPKVKYGRDPAGRRTVDFEATLARQSRFLALKDGQEAVVHVTCRGTEGTWQRLQIRKVSWKRR